MQHSRRRNRLGLRARLGTTAAASVVAVGLVVGTAAPAQAAVSFYHVSSSWFQAYAALTSTGGSGYFQARAKLGDYSAWGAYSQYNTKAENNGYNWTHNAWLYRNGSVWAVAQS